MKAIVNKTIEGIKKNYMTLNILVLGMITYIAFYPLISSLIQKVIPQFGKCTYLATTGKPCPLCGGTRYFANIFEAFQHIDYLWHPFGFMAIILFLEFIFRIKNIIDLKREKDCTRTIKIDTVTSTLIVIAFFTYEILFFIIN